MDIVYFCFCTVFKVNSDDVRCICLGAQTLAEKQSKFESLFITQIGRRPGVSNSKRRSNENIQKKGS